MNKPTVIYVLGLPATGKSTLAVYLSKELKLPLVSKDALKVILFDQYGWKDRETSMQAGRAAYDLIDYILEEQLRVGNSIIVESSPPKFASVAFNVWQKKYGARYIQICCNADADIIRERFQKRILKDSRHVSAVEGEAGLDNLNEFIKNGFKPINVESKIIEINTTDFSKVDETVLLKRLRKLLSS